MAGFSQIFPLFDSSGQALAFCNQVIQEKFYVEHWDKLETINLDCGTLRILPASNDQGAIEILGHVKDVLYAQVTVAHLCSKRFSETEYSIGLGGLGDRIDDYFQIMGEMITIGGTMVWLPTDGHDTPDFLIPKTDTGEVTLRTVFNASIAGHFNELIFFDSSEEKGTTIDTLYRELFRVSKHRRDDYKGVLALAMRTQMSSVFGSGVKKSPIAEFAPRNGEMLMSPANFDEWFDVDSEPRHADVTCLICGLGADLTCDLSSYDESELNSVFYLHPANTSDKTELLHNHAVIFTELPMLERLVNLEKEIGAVVEEGDFIDMRHLLDRSALKRAFIGVSYIQEFRRAP